MNESTTYELLIPLDEPATIHGEPHVLICVHSPDIALSPIDVAAALNDRIPDSGPTGSIKQRLLATLQCAFAQGVWPQLQPGDTQKTCKVMLPKTGERELRVRTVPGGFREFLDAYAEGHGIAVTKSQSPQQPRPPQIAPQLPPPQVAPQLPPPQVDAATEKLQNVDRVVSSAIKLHASLGVLSWGGALKRASEGDDWKGSLLSAEEHTLYKKAVQYLDGLLS